MFATTRFNPYRDWLGIDDSAGVGNLYALLALPPFESDATVIAIALAAQQAKLARARVDGRQALASRIAAELRLAEHCLLEPAAKLEYDRRLRGQRTRRSRWRLAAPPKSGENDFGASPAEATTETIGMQAGLTSANLVCH
jgi:hypothetical protein